MMPENTQEIIKGREIKMSMNETPRGERPNIAFFGCRNAGKSSLINAVTGLHISIVSDVAGTTTDPVYKSMELLTAGPVVVIDTPSQSPVHKFPLQSETLF